MAQGLAPYNNAMRLGQGFNSYTQQICVDSAVSPEDSSSANTLASLMSGSPKDSGVSQIVSYSSRFVDKLSDVTDAMNISASLSIKTSKIGGSASGSFIDSDKFKESDMNFFIQVKVTNQTKQLRDYTKFNKIDRVLPTQFNEVYGDCFISGWEEGGELNALLSVKCKDKSKKFEVQAQLEATLGTPALSGGVSGSFEMNKSEIQTSTETTITVNWSGGGQIKESNVIWDVNSLTLAATNFPDLVAKTPQKTYAILTKYTALRSFHEQMGGFQPLDYENAGVYTNALLDSYMDYKTIWKQIQVATFDLETKQTLLEQAKPTADILAYKPKKPKNDHGFLFDKNKTTPSAASSSTNGSKPAETVSEGSQAILPAGDAATTQAEIIAPNATTDSKAIVPADSAKSSPPKPAQSAVTIPLAPFTPSETAIQPYPATALGLDQARRDCRLEMVKIVHEVDLVTRDPSIALEPDRDGIFLSPVIFKQLLPVKKAPTNALSGNTDLGTAETSGPFFQSSRTPPKIVGDDIAKLATRSTTYRMSDWCGNVAWKEDNNYFNDIHTLDKTCRPKKLCIYHDAEIIKGYMMAYTNGKTIYRGSTSGSGSAFKTWFFDDSKFIQVTLMSTVLYGNSLLNGFSAVTSAGGLFSVMPPQRATSGLSITNVSVPEGEGWNLHGFWGQWLAGSCTINKGIVWGKDLAPLPPGWTAPATSLYTGTSLQPLVQDSVRKHPDKADMFRMSEYNGTMIKGGQFFNDLDHLEPDWRIKDFTLYAFDGWVQAVVVNWTNGRSKIHGSEPLNQNAIKFTYTMDTNNVVVGAETVCHKLDNGWIPLSSVKLIYFNPSTGLKTHETVTTSTSTVVSNVSKCTTGIHLAPAMDGSWTLKGFYGVWGGNLDAFGTIWGRE